MKIILRDGGHFDGGVYLTDGQALAPYLGSRKGGWVNVVNAVWHTEGQRHNHAVLQSDHILIAASPDVPVFFATAGVTARPVDVSLEDGTRVQGELHLLEKQRMSDYLSACGKFVPLLQSTRFPSGEVLGDIALNCGCVKAVRDAKVFAPGPEQTSESAAAEWGGIRRLSAAVQQPVNRDVIQHDTGAFEVITPGRIPDRRVGQAPYVSPRASQPVRAVPLTEAEMTPDLKDRANKVSRHWLAQVASGAQLAPPDPRELSPAMTLDDIWRGIARSNDIAEGEVSIYVANAYKLEVADLETATPEAIRIVPEKIARKLGVVPLTSDGKSLLVALSDPTSLEIEQQLGFATKLALRFAIATPSDIRKALDWHYRPSTTAKR